MAPCAAQLWGLNTLSSGPAPVHKHRRGPSDPPPPQLHHCVRAVHGITHPWCPAYEAYSGSEMPMHADADADAEAVCGTRHGPWWQWDFFLLARLLLYQRTIATRVRKLET